uniref:Inactive ubiquitin carboxyl-terminal hydrolase 53-like n=1 Tax=Stegastes partitus TaxID=144197 RepID=A0A3B5BD07_9TELE
MKWMEPMARPTHQLPRPSMSSCSKSPPNSGEVAGSNSMAWVKMFKKPGGGLKKSYQPGSMLSLALTKGLLNEPGQNSCFLNSAVQVLWQLDIFRRSLRQLSGHFCLGDACIFCALKSIFSQFQQSRERVLPSDSLRNALAETFKDEQRFQLGLMDDAAECFENILERIHLHIVSDTATDACSSKSCITHQKFAMMLYEQFVCRCCGASSDPHPFTEFVHYVSTTALCQQVDRMSGKSERLRSDMFGELLQAANNTGDLRSCPSDCGQSIKIRRVLMNCPEIVTIGFVWDAEQSDLTDDVIRSLGPRLNLCGLFNRVTDENAKRSELHLVGMICFASKHYSAFAYHTKSSKWMFFDDATVKEIGSKWKDVASKCIRGHFQPLLLFYTNPEGSPVSNEDAPRQTTMCPRYKAQVNGDVTVKHPLGSPNRFQEPFMENLQRPGETSKKDRGHRRTDPSQHKDMAHTRSSSPPENGPRPPVEKVKSHPRAEKSSNHSSRASQEPHGQTLGTQSGGHSRRTNTSPSRHDQDSCHEQWEKGGNGGSRGKSKSTWRPIREVLNVDTVLNELEQRRQQQHDSPRCSKPSSQERAHAEQSRDREREYARTREDRKQKCLMTIYEDEQRQETESHSSVESESRTSQQRGSRLKGGPKTLLRSDTWTIQRTESGYESSDRLSSGSTNPDSPGVDGFAVKDQRSAPEVQLQSQLHQKGGDAKSASSPSHNGKHQPKPQGKNHDQVSHSHLKGSPSSRRKSKYTSSTSRKAASSERNSSGSDSRQSEQQELTNCRGHTGESTTLRHITKTSSSEWNSSDDLALSEPEDRESTYLSSNSEAAASDSQCPHIALPYHPPSNVTAEPLQLNNQRQLATTGSPHLRPAQRISSHQGETSHAAFRPRMLQETFPSSPRLSSTSYISPHRKPDMSGLRTFSDASSKSGSDPERSTPSSCESEERLTGCRVEQAVPAQEVSLTTYFNVDNCMTETYRLKYHNQRPLVLSATVPRTVIASERRDNSHTLPSDTHSQDVPKARPETSKPL